MAQNGNVHDALVTSAQEFLKTPFDFVICGGGTAGLTLAGRLTENPNVSVGVLEAGECKLGDVFVDTPAMFTQMFGNDEYDWQFMTEPQVSTGQIIEPADTDCKERKRTRTKCTTWCVVKC
jgi:choline dehydrogenase-like flavoprotein